jgi:hypothetical protein
MLPQQKEAIATLVIAGICALIAVFVCPRAGLFVNESILGVILLFTLSLWIGRHITGFRSREMDERDRMIRYQAGLVAAHLFGAVVMAGAAWLYLLHRDTLQVPVRQVLLLAFWGWFALYVSWASSILFLFRRGGGI